MKRSLQIALAGVGTVGVLYALSRSFRFPRIGRIRPNELLPQSVQDQQVDYQRCGPAVGATDVWLPGGTVSIGGVSECVASPDGGYVNYVPDAAIEDTWREGGDREYCGASTVPAIADGFIRWRSDASGPNSFRLGRPLQRLLVNGQPIDCVREPPGHWNQDQILEALPDDVVCGDPPGSSFLGFRGPRRRAARCDRATRRWYIPD